MQTRIARLQITVVLAAGMAGLAISCASSGEQGKAARVTLAEMSAPARATVEKETAGGMIEKIEREVERGKVVYDVEASVGGEHREYLVADADGALLGTEVPVEFRTLPDPVRVAAEKYFGGADGLIAMKSVEYGETSYEIEGNRNGKRAEVSFDATGKRVP